MRPFFAALALTFAAPAAAQPATAHQDHQAQGHAEHQPGHAEHQSGHQGQGMGCCADRNNNGRMDCCENMAQPCGCCQPGQRPAAPPQPTPNR